MYFFLKSIRIVVGLLGFVATRSNVILCKIKLEMLLITISSTPT